MAHGGTLRLTGRGISRRRVAITVEDTGPGIHPDHLPKVFDLYFTTKQGGSGIGLSMVFRTVELNDGEIEVQSTLGTGTTFRIVLPQAVRAAAGAAAE
jgi:signal transduction histidine kinase